MTAEFSEEALKSPSQGMAGSNNDVAQSSSPAIQVASGPSDEIEQSPSPTLQVTSGPSDMIELSPSPTLQVTSGPSDVIERSPSPTLQVTSGPSDAIERSPSPALQVTSGPSDEIEQSPSPALQVISGPRDEIEQSPSPALQVTSGPSDEIERSPSPTLQVTSGPSDEIERSPSPTLQVTSGPSDEIERSPSPTLQVTYGPSDEIERSPSPTLLVTSVPSEEVERPPSPTLQVPSSIPSDEIELPPSPTLQVIPGFSDEMTSGLSDEVERTPTPTIRITPVPSEEEFPIIPDPAANDDELTTEPVNEIETLSTQDSFEFISVHDQVPLMQAPLIEPVQEENEEEIVTNDGPGINLQTDICDAQVEEESESKELLDVDNKEEDDDLKIGFDPHPIPDQNRELDIYNIDLEPRNKTPEPKENAESELLLATRQDEGSDQTLFTDLPPLLTSPNFESNLQMMNEPKPEIGIGDQSPEKRDLSTSSEDEEATADQECTDMEVQDTQHIQSQGKPDLVPGDSGSTLNTVESDLKPSSDPEVIPLGRLLPDMQPVEFGTVPSKDFESGSLESTGQKTVESGFMPGFDAEPDFSPNPESELLQQTLSTLRSHTP